MIPKVTSGRRNRPEDCKRHEIQNENVGTLQRDTPHILLGRSIESPIPSLLGTSHKCFDHFEWAAPRYQTTQIVYRSKHTYSSSFLPLLLQKGQILLQTPVWLLIFHAYKVLLVKKSVAKKTELKWLQGEIKVSRLFEYKIRSRIKKKVQTLFDLELPLLIQTSFTNYENSTELGRDFETGNTKTMAQALVRQRSRKRALKVQQNAIILLS